MRSALAGVLALAATAAAADHGPILQNPSFDADGVALTGWQLEVGAGGGGGPTSEVAVDSEVARDRRGTLRLSGGADTANWRMVQQEFPVAGGDRVVLTVSARSRAVAPSRGQRANANALVSFHAADGKRLAIVPSAVLNGDRDWVDLVVHAIAPEGAVSARAGLFLSMSGTVWFDDVRLSVRPTSPFDERARADAFDALAGHLRRTYPFWGTPGKPDPEKLLAAHRARVVEAKDRQHFLAALEAMLAELHDVHVYVAAPEGNRFPTPAQATPRNWNIGAIVAALGKPLVAEKHLLAGRVGEGEEAIGYVQIGSFALDESLSQKLDEALDAVAGAKALVIDVRANGGGDERIAARVAGRFTKHPLVYASCAFRDPTLPGTEGLGAPAERVLPPLRRGEADTRPVVVLQGPYCVSSTEGFLLMMRALPNVTTMGLPSRGASGNPGPFQLLPDVTVWTSRWRSLTPDGACIEGVGVAPEVVVDAPATAYESGDPTLERALEHLRR